MSKKTTHVFTAETKQLLDLMIHSIYTHKEIFLRELLSNASDALDKVRFASLTDPDKYKNTDDLCIKIEPNDVTKTLTITDNGIGMSEKEVVENIGTIARSGTKAFLEELKNRKENVGSDLIGRFGVGFYSAFMVADEITIETKSEDEPEGVRWQSKGDGNYTIEKIEKEKRGTSVTLHLKKKEAEDDNAYEDYADRYLIQKLVKKYSDYVRFPIKMNMAKPKENDKEVTQYEEKTLNSMKSLWQTNKNDIKKEEYDDFYKTHFHDYEEPLEVIHTKAEGTIEYTALLFIPSHAPFNFFREDFEKGLQLYSRNVFIMEKCKDVVPDYLRFVTGLVDSPDFSLNISRELLQHTGELKKISSNIEKKVLDTLTSMLKNDKEKYEKFWKEFGEAVKMGVYSGVENKEKLMNLVLFKSSKSDDKYITLAEYKNRMKESQDEIYYAVGKDKESIDNLPHMESMRENDYEVLYFTERVDEFMANMAREYEEKKLRSISQGEIKQKDEKEKTIDAKITDVLTAMKNILGDKVAEVKETSRLKESVVCFVSKEDGLSFNMARVLSETGNNMFGLKAEKIMEVNTHHALFEKIKNEFETNKESNTFKEYSELLYDQACLLEGMPLEDVSMFTKRISSLMLK